jgi:adenylate cyclase class 1
MGNQDTTIAGGLRAFTLYNRAKKDFMYKCDPVGARVVLEFLPLLLHINHPSLPGHISGDDCPCGVKLMDWPAKTSRRSVRLLLPMKIGNVHDYLPREHEIEGLFTIGSVGSLAQTRDSDYDIWVVVDSRKVSPVRLKVLDRKLKLLKRWISGKFVLAIHFFLMDLQTSGRTPSATCPMRGRGRH